MVTTQRPPGSETETPEGVASVDIEVLPLNGPETAEYIASLVMELHRLAVAAKLDGLASELQIVFYLASALAKPA